jgi:hypothetical protein
MDNVLQKSVTGRVKPDKGSKLKHLYVSTNQICYLYWYNRRTLSQGESTLNIKKPFKTHNIQKGGEILIKVKVNKNCITVMLPVM